MRAPRQGGALLRPGAGHELDEVAARDPHALQQPRAHLQLVPAHQPACADGKGPMMLGTTVHACPHKACLLTTSD